MGRKRSKEVIVEGVTFSGIADRGKAVGRDEEGKVYFATGAVPGDVATILRLKKRKGVYQAKVREVTTPSPHRVEPFCEHFGMCGGCKWQNLDYAKQLTEKQRVVSDAMRRIGHIDTEVQTILGGEQQTFYRNKVEYSFSNKRWLTDEEIKSDAKIPQSPAVGFHSPGAFDRVVDIQKCYLQHETSNRIRNHLREVAHAEGWKFYDAKTHEGFLRNIYLRNNRKGQWMLTVCFNHKKNDLNKAVLDNLLENFPEISSLYYVINQKHNDSIADQEAVHYSGDLHLEESLDHVSFYIGPKSFFQTNTYQAEVMYQQVAKLADLKGDEVVYDLYTGIGSIGLYLAEKVGKIVGIEAIPEAIEDAKLNMAKNEIENCVFYAGDVKEILSETFWAEHGRPDVLITDPPRAGMHGDVVAMLLQLQSPKIVYVSCNPATQARDLALLSEMYSVDYLQPIDMFPHTHHIENIALLTLK